MADTLHIRCSWTTDRVAIAQVVAVLPVLVAALYEQGASLLPVLTAALAVTFFWQLLFAKLRNSSIGWDGIVTATVLVLLIPGTVPTWQVALALTFGVVLGEQIFGGCGRAILHPSAVALAFLFFSFPAHATGAASPLVGMAMIPGAILLIGLGLASWRVISAAFLSLSFAGLIVGVDPIAIMLSSGAFAVALVLLGCDPVSSAATDVGRLVYGVLIGCFSVILGTGGATIENSTAVFAVLLASIFAPAIDRGVIGVRGYRMGYRRA